MTLAVGDVSEHTHTWYLTQSTQPGQPSVGRRWLMNSGDGLGHCYKKTTSSQP